MATAVYEVDPVSMYEGQYRNDKVAAMWANALDTDNFGGYATGIDMTRQQGWAMTHERDEGED